MTRRGKSGDLPRAVGMASREIRPSLLCVRVVDDGKVVLLNEGVEERECRNSTSKVVVLNVVAMQCVVIK